MDEKKFPEKFGAPFLRSKSTGQQPLVTPPESPKIRSESAPSPVTTADAKIVDDFANALFNFCSHVRLIEKATAETLIALTKSKEMSDLSTQCENLKNSEINLQQTLPTILKNSFSKINLSHGICITKLVKKLMNDPDCITPNTRSYETMLELLKNLHVLEEEHVKKASSLSTTSYSSFVPAFPRETKDPVPNLG